MPSPSADAERAQQATGGDSKQAEEKRSVKDEEGHPPAAAPSESSSEENLTCDSESLDLQLSAAAADNGLLHIEESDDSPEELSSPKENGPENGSVSGMKDLSSPQKVCVLRSSQLRTGDANLFCV